MRPLTQIRLNTRFLRIEEISNGYGHIEQGGFEQPQEQRLFGRRLRKHHHFSGQGARSGGIRPLFEFTSITHRLVVLGHVADVFRLLLLAVRGQRQRPAIVRVEDAAVVRGQARPVGVVPEDLGMRAGGRRRGRGVQGDAVAAGLVLVLEGLVVADLRDLLQHRVQAAIAVVGLLLGVVAAAVQAVVQAVVSVVVLVLELGEGRVGVDADVQAHAEASRERVLIVGFGGFHVRGAFSQTCSVSSGDGETAPRKE